MELYNVVQGGGIAVALASLGVISFLVKQITNHLQHASTVLAAHMEEISKNTLKTLTIVERMNGKHG